MSLDAFNNAVQNIPYWDEISNLYEYNMGEHFTTKDPFYQKFPEKNPATLKPHEKMTYTEKRRKPPPYITEKQRKLWKQVMKRAWYHDRNFCGCMPIDLGCGMISFVSIFPIIGSIIAYKMHYKLIKACHQAGAPAYLQAEMVGNIGLDFVMTLVPLLGVLLSWMKASSTRNAALFDTWLREQSNEQHMKRMAAARQQASVPVPQRGEVRPPANQNARNGAPYQATVPSRVPTTQTVAPGTASNGQSQTRAPPYDTSAPMRPQPAQTRPQTAQASQAAQARPQPGQVRPQPAQTRPQPVQTSQQASARPQPGQIRPQPGQVRPQSAQGQASSHSRPQSAQSYAKSSPTAPALGSMPRSASQTVSRKPVPSQQPPPTPPHTTVRAPERAATSQVRMDPDHPRQGPPLPPKVPLNFPVPPSPSTYASQQPSQPITNLGKPPPVPKKTFYPPPAGMYP